MNDSSQHFKAESASFKAQPASVKAQSASLNASPVPDPEQLNAPGRSKRAWVLWLLTLLVPGGAQLVTGYKSLGRKALTVTVSVWVALLILVAWALINRGSLLDVFSRPWVLVLVGIVLALLAVGWLLLFVHTYRITKPTMLAPGMRGIVTVFTALAVVITSGGLGYGSYLAFKSKSTLGTIFASGPAVDPVDGRYNILVLGGDAGKSRVGLRPDSAQVWSIDAKSGRAVVISIPRNLQNAPFPEGSPMRKVYPNGFNCGDECIFNAIYPTVEQEHADKYPDTKDPGAVATMEAASAVTGLQIDMYVTVDMGGFEHLIDALGGVKIVSGGWVPYNGKRDPNTGLRTKWFSPGEHHFTGKQALWFARSRDFATDYHRIRRQQCLQQAMIKQFTPQNVLVNFTQIMDSGEEIVRTNIPQSQLGSFIGLAEKTRQHSFLRLTLGAPDFGKPGDLFSTYPDYDLIHQRVGQLVAKATDDGAKAQDDKPRDSQPQGSKPQDSGEQDSQQSSQQGQASGKSKPQVTQSSPEPSSEASLGAEDQVITTQRDGSPITEKYLQELEYVGDTGRIEQIAQNNDSCKVG